MSFVSTVSAPPLVAFIEGIGGMEMLLVAVIGLLLFGGKGLPDMARTLGRVIREFKKASAGVEEEMRRVMHEEPPRPQRPRPAPAPAALTIDPQPDPHRHEHADHGAHAPVAPVHPDHAPAHPPHDSSGRPLPEGDEHPAPAAPTTPPAGVPAVDPALGSAPAPTPPPSAPKP